MPNSNSSDVTTPPDRAREREREEARFDAGGEEPNGPIEGGCPAEVSDR
ncbi:MAG: hypothetical protein ABSA11_12830 [Candidatus Bathyarchaeia archaeon]